MSDFDEAEHRRDQGGRFARKEQPETDPGLGLDGFNDAAVQDLEAVEHLDTEGLWAAIRDPRSEFRCEALESPNISQEQIDTLAADPDPAVRWKVARSGLPGVADRLAADPDPMVRLSALETGMLPSGVVARLEADEVVQSVYRKATEDN